MTLFEMVAEGAQRVREIYGWGGSFVPEDDPVDPTLIQPAGEGLSQLDQRQWREKDVEVVCLKIGTVFAGKNGPFQASATVYPGLSAGQYEVVKSQIETVHEADLHDPTPFYERQAVKITSTLQADCVVIVVTAQQKDEPPQAIGYLNIGPADSKTGQRQIGILVLAAFRRKGISRQLFTFVVEKSASLNMKSFWVQYNSSNNDVKNFLLMIENDFKGKVEVKHDRSNPQEWSANLEIK